MPGFFKNMGRGETCCTDCGQATPCEPCCPTTLPAFVYDSVSASKSKTVVYPENTAFISSPPRYYRQIDFTGSLFERSVTGLIGRQNFAGTCLRDLDGNQLSTATETVIRGSWTGSEGEEWDCDEANESVTTDVFPLPNLSFTCPVSATRGIRRSFGGGCTPDPAVTYCENTLEGNLSVEYTTAALIAHAYDSLPAFDDDRNDTAGSMLSLASNETSVSVRRAKGFLPLTAISAELTAGRSYTLVYVVRFTPASGSPIDGAELTHDFTYTAGQTHVAVGDVPDPTANGTNTLHLVRWECPTE